MIKWLICIIWGHSYKDGAKFFGVNLSEARCTRCFKKHEDKPKMTFDRFGLGDEDCPHGDSYDVCPDCRH